MDFHATMRFDLVFTDLYYRFIFKWYNLSFIAPTSINTGTACLELLNLKILTVDIVLSI